MKKSELRHIIREEIKEALTFNIKGDSKEVDWTPHHVEMYYDRKTKFWIVQLQTKENYQIGDAEYSPSKKDAQKTKKDWERKIK